MPSMRFATGIVVGAAGAAVAAGAVRWLLGDPVFEETTYTRPFGQHLEVVDGMCMWVDDEPSATESRTSP